MQTAHGASKEETVDMVRYFISRLKPFEIEMKVTAKDGHPVTRKWTFSRCHYPGCGYINGKGYSVDSHVMSGQVRSSHKEMKKDIRTLEWF
jgi:methionine-rich copper-binding protein CopC